MKTEKLIFRVLRASVLLKEIRSISVSIQKLMARLGTNRINNIRKLVKLAQLVEQWIGNPETMGSTRCLTINFLTLTEMVLISFYTPDARKILKGPEQDALPAKNWRRLAENCISSSFEYCSCKHLK